MKNIKEIRADRNLSQQEAADLLDISKEYLSMIECGKRNPSDALKEKFSLVYKLPVTDIFLSIQETKRYSDDFCYNQRWFSFWLYMFFKTIFF